MLSLLRGVMGAAIGAVAGLPALLVFFWFFTSLGLPLSCSAGVCFSPVYDGVFLSIPVILLLLCAAVVYRLVDNRHLVSPIPDGVLVGLAVTFDSLAFYVFYNLTFVMGRTLLGLSS
jgi:hypothetical protein